MSQLHALLIGIDDYFPNRLGRFHYPSLDGAAGDAMRMALYLSEHFGLRPEKTRMLLSLKGADGQPTEPPERLPTYANIVAAFKALAFDAMPGDFVYVHYSGHGSRTPTQHPKIKGKGSQDESLVPCDIFTPGSRYLYDLELATLVRLLVERDLRVTLVLDCCHAGGAMRGGPAASRGTGEAVPRRVPWVAREPVQSAVADLETLAEVWKNQQRDRDGRSYRGVTLKSNLPVARYSLFAACRPDELAFEYPFDNRQPQGVLTHWLLDTLQRSSGEMACGEIHQRLVARIRGSFASQTPMFIGDGESGFLKEKTIRARVRAVESPRVLRVDETGRVLIGAGLTTGTRPGDRIRLNDATELEITRVGATESWAEVIRALGPDPIEPGEPVDFLRLLTSVRLVPPEEGNSEAESALNRLRDTLRQSGAGFIEACENGAAPDLCVAVTEGTYEVLDPGGTRFPHLLPLPVSAPGVIPKLIRRLDHLAKFRNILTVENPKAPKWLGIDLELHDDTGALLSAGAVDLREGESLIVRVVNRSRVRLDFVVLDLTPDYSVVQLLPKKRSLSLLPLDPGQKEEVRIKGWLPRGIDEGNDVLKVFATQGAVNFRWLELPVLDRPLLASPFRGEPKSQLERLFARLTANRPAKRSGLNPSEFPEEEWITAQVEIRVRR